MSAHTDALEEIQRNLIKGDILEITSKPNWGFEELPNRIGISADSYLVGPNAHFPNIILHILAGEGVPIDAVKQTITKAIQNGTRVLILEHNPNYPDFDDDVNVTRERFDAAMNATGCGVNIAELTQSDERNILVVLTPIDHVDNTFSNVNVEAQLAADNFVARHAPQPNIGIYCHTSEGQPDGTFLLDAETVDFVDSLPVESGIYSVLGGLMFLDMIAELQVPRQIVLFDQSLRQLFYGLTVVYIISQCETIEAFDEFTQAGYMGRLGVTADPKLDNLCLMGQYARNMRRAADIIDRPDKGMVWRNLLKVGKWRDQYQKVKQAIHGRQVTFSWQGVPEMIIPDDSVIYTSTVPLEHFAKYNCHMIDCMTNRDRPTLVKMGES